jgi:uncharacterized damage-inducible protein DinB
MNLRDYFAYSERCRPLLYETLVTCGEETLHREFTTTGVHNTIAKILAHSHGAEERWITMRLLAQPLLVLYEERAATTLEGLIADGDTFRQATYAYLNAQTPELLQRPYTFVILDKERHLTAEECLFHIVHHESWHRGQIALLLQQFGFDPPNFDYALVRG